MSLGIEGGVAAALAALQQQLPARATTGGPDLAAAGGVNVGSNHGAITARNLPPLSQSAAAGQAPRRTSSSLPVSPDALMAQVAAAGGGGGGLGTRADASLSNCPRPEGTTPVRGSLVCTSFLTQPWSCALLSLP
jgi:hypothetical protein